MRKSKRLALALATALVVGAPMAAAAQPFPPGGYVWGGRNYCWYPVGWRGPGWYWCGYARRRGVGWGGPAGWRGWRHDGRFHRGHYGGGFHGGHGGFHGEHHR